MRRPLPALARTGRRECLALALALCAAIAVSTRATPVGETAAHTRPQYKRPPDEIVRILESPPEPFVVLSPSRDWAAVYTRRAMPPLSELAQPTVALAGTRLNPATRVPHRLSDVTGLLFASVTDDRERPVLLPRDALVLPLGFSPNGDRLAFGLIQSDGVRLWLVDVASARAREVVLPTRLNVAATRRPCEWTPDGASLVCLTTPRALVAMPARPVVPDGPVVEETSDTASPVRTYADLLRDDHDEKLFDFCFHSQIVVVQATGRGARTIGAPGVYESVSPSPDGRHLLVHRLERPYSRLLPFAGFPKTIEVWTREGAREHVIATVPTAEHLPLNGVLEGPRDVRWVPTSPSRLHWTEALDGGDPTVAAPRRDRVMTSDMSGAREPRVLGEFEYRVMGVRWTDGGAALVTEQDRARRWTRTWIVDRSGQRTRRLWDRSVEDQFSDPGQLVTRPDERTVLEADGHIYLSGRGPTPDGDRPFLDRLDLETLTATRLFRSPPDVHETVGDLLDLERGIVMTRRESASVPPHRIVRVLGRPQDPGRVLRATLTGATSFGARALRYRRADGIELSATLYLPPGYREGTRVPVIVWAYPREYSGPGVAAQAVAFSNRFTPLTGASPLLLTTQGYAVLYNASMPVIGPRDRANDTYAEQLVADARAAVDALVASGVADPRRIAIGGHSYGAAMAVNLLAHSNLFRMGIACSGAYNRTLTPFGFQTESRTFWQAPSMYAGTSAFWRADAIRAPLLLVHGELDNNSGTSPLQSERLFRALQGLGGRARYVNLPYEAHNYAARESVLHVVAEMLDWANRYLRDADGQPTASQEVAH